MPPESDVPGKKSKEESISNMEGNKKHEFPSFWVPQLLPTATETKLEKPVKIFLLFIGLSSVTLAL